MLIFDSLDHWKGLRFLHIYRPHLRSHLWKLANLNECVSSNILHPFFLARIHSFIHFLVLVSDPGTTLNVGEGKAFHSLSSLLEEIDTVQRGEFRSGQIQSINNSCL